MTALGEFDIAMVTPGGMSAWEEVQQRELHDGWHVRLEGGSAALHACSPGMSLRAQACRRADMRRADAGPRHATTPTGRPRPAAGRYTLGVHLSGAAMNRPGTTNVSVWKCTLWGAAIGAAVGVAEALVAAMGAIDYWRTARIHWGQLGFACPGLAALVGYVLATRLNRRRAEREARGLCRRCGYDLAGNVSGRCPECGKPARQVNQVPARADVQYGDK